MRVLWLASASPRRFQLLQEGGFRPRQIPAQVNDDDLAEAADGVEATCAARAWFKAMAARHTLCTREEGPSEDLDGILLAADTLCESDGQLLGKASGPTEAEAMIRQLAGKEHRTVTGVALLDLTGAWRSIWCDMTRVRMGELDESQIVEYVSSNQWQGKSGSYNLAERIEAGWPIEYDGDPATVMGLPMQKLTAQLNALLRGAVP